MTLYVTNPFGYMLRRRMLERMMDGDWTTSTESEVNFPVDVKAEEEAFVISAILPGIKAEDLNIQIVSETVSIQGEFKDERDPEGHYLLQERPSGRFNRVIELPDQLDPDKAEAEMLNGILTLRVPKAEQSRPKTIKIVAK
jgi:HSP20 family protein